MRKKLFILFLILISSFGVYSEEIDRVVAIVDTTVITYSELKLQAISTATALGKQNDTLYVKKIEPEVLNNMIMEELLYNEGLEDTTIKISEEQVEDALYRTLKQMISTFGSKENFEKELNKEGLTLEDWKTLYFDRLKKNMIIQQVMNKDYSFSSTEIPDYEVDSFISVHRDSLFNEKNRMYEVSALIKYIKPSERTIKKQMDMAETIRDSIEKGLLSFQRAVLIYSKDTVTMKEGGFIGNQKVSQWVSIFGERIADIPVGKPFVFSSVLGIHIVEKTDVSPTGDSFGLKHIFFRVIPSSSDSITYFNLMKNIRNEYLNGASFDSLAMKYSDDIMSKKNGGKLGNLYGKDLPFNPDTIKNDISNPIYMKEPIPMFVLYHIDSKESDAAMKERIRNTVKVILQNEEKQRIYDIIRKNLQKKHFVEIRL